MPINPRPISWIKAAQKDFEDFSQGARIEMERALTILAEGQMPDIAKHLFEVVGSGKVKIPVNQKYKLKDAVKAHQDLEGRNTTGSTILVP